MAIQPVLKLQSLCRCTVAGSACNGEPNPNGISTWDLCAATWQTPDSSHTTTSPAAKGQRRFWLQPWKARWESNAAVSTQGNGQLLANRMTRHIARETRQQLLGGFAGGIGTKGRMAPAFPQVGNAGIEQRRRQIAQNPGDHVKTGAHLLRNRPEVAIEDVIERHKAQAWQERTWVRHRKPRERCEDA